jgi:LPXTG-motif cell wall-anchored protein
MLAVVQDTSDTIWLIVGILAIIALFLFIIGRR